MKLTGVALLAAEAETLLEAEPLTLSVAGALLLNDCTAQRQGRDQVWQQARTTTRKAQAWSRRQIGAWHSLSERE
jgi:hypothetical protein